MARKDHVRPPSMFRCALATMLVGLLAQNLLATPTGMTVGSGSASVTTAGSQTTITASQNAFLNWQSFNIGASETTTFVQPSAASIVWNRINDPNPSRILGNLNANGTVVLMNSSGFFFGPNSVVKAAGFVATTATPPADFGSGSSWEFTGAPPAASIINYGQIKVNNGGSLFLIANAIENHGILSAPDGTLGLYAGKEVLISDQPDGRGLSVSVKLPEGSVDNYGKLIADSGSILVHAQTINQDGLIQANSVREKNGVIELVASDVLNLGSQSDIEASGDDSGASTGGQITLKSDNTLADESGSVISVAGGANGGNGGFVEMSADTMVGINSIVDGHAASGWTGGQFLIDPNNITIGTSGTGSAGSGTVNSGDAPATGTLSLNVNSAFVGFSHIDLQAKNNITLSANTTWDLVASTGISAPGSQLTLEAGNNITLNDGSSILGGSGWSVTLEAGRNFSSANAVVSGVGNLTFTGSAGLQTQDGNITLLAGNNITVNSGYVRTMGGGNINATAVAGSINTGTLANGFTFLPIGSGFMVNSLLGGISTGAGGNVNLTAGLDVVSFLPVTGVAGSTSDAGSGAFGSQAGNVTITAGRNVTGHYVLMNGTGTINAGQDAGNASRALALSLASGGWTVNAVNNILLQEVRNPNGIFNSLGFSSSTTKHEFTYASDAYVDLSAGNGVTLSGAALPRNSGSFEQNIPSIYAPILNILAGAGGVNVGGNIILFPSAQGQLTITTTGGGSLVGTQGGTFSQITMSDSSANQYASAVSFGPDDHAATPIHLNDPTPVTLNIAGDFNNILLAMPKVTDITVGGDMNNSRLQIQNLHPTDVSVLNVAGDIENQNEFTSVPLANAPNFSWFDHAYGQDALLANLPGSFSYNASTHTLTFQGRMTTDELNALLNLQIQQFDPLSGAPLFDINGNPLLTTVQVLDTATATALFNASQDVPLNPNTGYTISGPGTFNVFAHDLDLGATLGIRSIGPANNPALAPLGSSGAAINVNLTGDLDMFSTTISSIAGGNVTINAGGDVNVGSATFVGNDQYARGIFTVAKSDVSVIADGDINVNGSRIAAYDGGDVTVESLHGNVNAGTGGQGVATVQEVKVDPVTFAVLSYETSIPGSGILATTFPPAQGVNFPSSHNSVGNITVLTPEGDIIANAGGVLQLPLNGVDSSASSITLTAGTKDADGNVIHVGNIDANGSGIIGANVNLDASGDITGFIVAQHDLNVTAIQSVSVTAVAAGNASISAGGSISGTIVGVGSVTASGSSIDASLLSQNVSASGASAGAQVGFAQVNVASATSQSAAATDEPTKQLAAEDTQSDDNEKNKKQRPALTKTGRVTVILPQKG